MTKTTSSEQTSIIWLIDDRPDEAVDLLVGKLEELNLVTKKFSFFSDPVNNIVKGEKPDFCVLDLFMAHGAYPKALSKPLRKVRRIAESEIQRQGQIFGIFCEEQNIPFCYFSNHIHAYEPKLHQSEVLVFDKSNQSKELIELVQKQVK